MTTIDAITLLLVCQLLGEGLRVILSIPIPGAILGMLLLLVWLMMVKKNRPTLKAVTSWLTAHLSIMFLPAAVGLINEKSNIKNYGLQIAFTVFCSSLITMSVSAYIFHLVAKKMGKQND